MTNQLYAKSFVADQARPTGSKGHAEILHFGDITATRSTFPPGWRWTVIVKPIARTGLCQFRHIGYVVSRHIMVRLADGTKRELAVDDAFDLPPAHDTWVLGDKPHVSVDLTLPDDGRAM